MPEYPHPSEVDAADAGGGLESTRELIDRARHGDQEAVDRLFARHLCLMQRWARGRLPSWARDVADTDDLVQDALLHTFKKHRGLRTSSRRRVPGLSAPGRGQSPARRAATERTTARCDGRGREGASGGWHTARGGDRARGSRALRASALVRLAEEMKRG
jgi:hypothetical protein